MNHKSELFFLFGLWISFVGIFIAGTSLLPRSTDNPDTLVASALLSTKTQEVLGFSSEASNVKSLYLDLDRMIITLSIDGEQYKTFPILSRPKKNSMWDTPSGRYAVESKEPLHFSHFLNLWMPYSVSFGPNYFLHGWPLDSEREPVSLWKSDGGFRLSVEDAQHVYEFAETGVAVTIYGGNEVLQRKDFSYTPPEDTLQSSVTASHFSVGDIKSGGIMLERKSAEPIHPGKLVVFPVALAAVETVDQYTKVRIGELLLGKKKGREALGGSDELTLGSLLYALLFDTNGTAAKVFEEYIGKEELAQYVNMKIRAIGLSGSQFTSVDKDAPATTTANDLFTLLRYVANDHSYLIHLSQLPGETFVSGESKTKYHWENNNITSYGVDVAYKGGIGTLDADGGGSGLFVFSVPVSEFRSREIGIVAIDSKNILADINELRAMLVKKFIYESHMAGEVDVQENIDDKTQKEKTSERVKEMFNQEIYYDRSL